MKKKIKKASIYTFFLIVGIAMLLLGIVCPFYFRGISPALIKKAGNKTIQVQDLANELTNYGRISPVFELNYSSNSLDFGDRLLKLAKENPSYYFSGGSAPYVEEIIRRLGLKEKDYREPTTVVELFTPKTHREYISDFLSRTRNSNVLDVLETRNLKGTVIFSPVDSPSGTPLDIAILTTALLIQAEETPRRLAADIASVARGAAAGDPHAIEQIEEFYLAILTLAKRFQWVSLSELMRNLSTTESIFKTAELFRRFPGDKSLVFASLLLTHKPDQIHEFIIRYGNEAIIDLKDSVNHGEGAISLLIERMSPIYRPHAWNQWLDKLQTYMLNTPIYRVAISNPKLTGIIKLFFLFSSGLSFIILVRLFIHKASSNYRGWLASFLSNMGNIAIAVAFSISVWLALEPEFLKQEQSSPPPLEIKFVTANPFENLKSDVMNNMQIDQVTLLILGLFFIMQVAIYAYSRVRLQEIKKLDKDPEIKLKLIENEENLFDSGLYVGLGGTVASLIMLAVNIVEASLMAAYASTLFGIIFVAILKIFSVRPYRHEVILQLETARRPKGPSLKIKPQPQPSTQQLEL